MKEIRSIFEENFRTIELLCDKSNDGSYQPGSEVIKLFTFSTQLSIKFILLINVKMPKIVGILTFMSRINYWLW